MANAPELPWPFLAVLASTPPARKGDEPPPPPIRGLGYLLGPLVVTPAHVTETADLAWLPDGSQVTVDRLATESGLGVMRVPAGVEASVRLGEASDGQDVTVAMVSDFSPRVRLVRGRTAMSASGDFTAELESRLGDDESPVGSPVLGDGVVVGIVGPTSTNRTVDVIPAQSVLRFLGRRYPDLGGDQESLSAQTRAALGYADDITEAVGINAAVLLGVLWSGDLDLTSTVASELRARVERPIEQVVRALGANPPERPTLRPDGDLWESKVGLMLGAAETIRTRAGAGRIHRRHVLLAVLSRPPKEFAERTFEELGVPHPELRRALREIMAERHEDERPAWAPLLAGPFDLAGGVAADFVDPARGIALEDDRLGLSVDVTMFATLIADVKTPMPLSVGLFGEWGSGKSYFMALLRNQIEVLSRSSDSRYHSDIVQIGFNAWHYADSNLWASLGDEIFAELARPHDDSGDARRALLRDELADRLQHRQELQAATDRARAETERLTTALDEAKATRRTSARDLAAAVLEAPALREELEPAMEKLGATEASEQVRLLAGELEQAPEDVAVTGRAVAGAPLWLLAAGVVVAIAAIAGGILASEALAGVAAALLTALTIVGVVAARVRSGARLLHEVAGGLRRRRDAAVAGELAQLRQAETSERVLQAQLDEAIGQVGELSRELAELTPGRRLYSFVAERAASDVYRGQLGLISTIRKDFEELSDLMREWRAEKSKDDAKRPIDRIVLYIDDLDRCSPEQVVEVLQAVHLLLALDLFVVVVGVDPRWLLHSLRREYRSMLTTPAPGTARDPRWETTPQDYLEKIFNIPFALPRMTPASFKQLVDSFAETEEEEPPRETADTPAPPEPDEAPEPEAAAEPEAVPAIPEPEPMRAEARSEVAALQAGVEEPERRPLTTEELAMLASLAPLVETPRETKRLVNLYRMMRSTRDLSPAARFLGDDAAPGEYQAVVILLGLLSGHARLLPDVLVAPVRDGVKGGLRGRPPEESWADFAAGLAPRADGDAFTNDVVGEIPADEVEEWTRLAGGLEEVGKLVGIPDLRPFQTWAPRIARFSFLLSPYADEAEKR